jgi:hypothetical protein
MTHLIRFAIPATLALAVCAAQAEGFSPSAGGQHRGDTARSSTPGTAMTGQPATPSDGTSGARSATTSRPAPAGDREAGFLGA